MSGAAGTAGSAAEAGAGFQPGAAAGGEPTGAGGAAGAQGQDDQGQQSQGVDYEKAARADGWVSKEEFRGDPEEWVDAKEFIRRKPLFNKVKNQSQRIRELTQTVDAISKHFNSSLQAAKDQAMAELKAERAAAIKDGDPVRVDEIEQRMEEVKNTPAAPAAKTGPDPEVVDFTEKHKSWFGVDKAMTRFAVTFNESYLAENPGKLEESLKETERAVRAAFPDKFTNPRRQDPPPVDEGGNSGAGAGHGKYTLNRLTAEQKLVYDQLVTRHGQLSHEQYFKDLESAGFLEK